MIALLLALAQTLATPVPLDVEWSVDGGYLAGQSFQATISITAGPEGDRIPVWLLGPGAFEKDDVPLGPRPEGMLELPAAAALTITFDLGPALGDTKSFSLGFFEDYSVQPDRPIRALVPFTDEATDFMAVPAETLPEYAVLMQTNRGVLVFELWPDVAPNHVRNFLDLNHRGFFEGTIFHRVSPSFMIQGGDGAQRIGADSRWTGGSAPRMVNAEFSDRRHVRGVLSAARGPDVNSANSQFFVMMTKYPSLDGSYSAYGRLIAGQGTLDLIANAPGTVSPRDGTVRPSKPQQILRTTVLKTH